MTQRVVVAAAIVRNERVLGARRSAPHALAGRWIVVLLPIYNALLLYYLPKRASARRLFWIDRRVGGRFSAAHLLTHRRGCENH